MKLSLPFHKKKAVPTDPKPPAADKVTDAHAPAPAPAPAATPGTHPSPATTAQQAYPANPENHTGKPAAPKKRAKASKRPPSADHETKEYIIDSLSMLLSTGVTVGEALDSIAAELPKKLVKQAIQDMRTKIDDGMPFSKALAETGMFNQSAVALIEVGEDSGRLPENLSVIAAQMHKTNVMAAKIRSAMLYPSFLIGLLFVVGTGVGVFLLPKLLGVIQGLGEKVGLITQIVIKVGTFMGHWGLLMGGAVVALCIAIAVMVKYFIWARRAGEAILYHIPGIKKLLFETEMARLGFILGTLLDSGLPVVTALQSLSSSMATHRYREFAKTLAVSIEDGNSFAKTFADHKELQKLIPSTIRQLIISGEKSGNLSVSLRKIGVTYEDKSDITARNLETLLEPVILVIIAVCVLFVAISVLLPIYSLVGNLSQD